ncbi:MAG: heme-binding protein [Pseudomonadota bacterium]
MLFNFRHPAVIFIGIIVVLILTYFIYYYISMRNVKEPSYQLIKKEGAIQIRQYAPMIVAQVNESGDRDMAIRAGFRQLADYIFGNNTDQANKNTKIEMTAPVLQQNSQKIAMTAPVIQTPTETNQWQVRFVMPKTYTLATLPKPNNPNVKVYQQAAKKFVVIVFSGSITDQNIKQHLALLKQYISKHQLNVTGSPVYAFYNPPWTLPFMRRNEILFELVE